VLIKGGIAQEDPLVKCKSSFAKEKAQKNKVSLKPHRHIVKLHGEGKTRTCKEGSGIREKGLKGSPVRGG